ncbi:hypothetical protein [Parahaliea aestuarii]|uniref:Uncharacterized protein n=1 Tax=Parahaliea aestuarii TaxID=1852021 RepID=A0A5C8ZNK2_9GAMM|nr:hypothetical protein [Parahaliea aestuarii]TXS89334.1 hypothetical protein FVW59_17605 [Parahaliea aestuarii]
MNDQQHNGISQAVLQEFVDKELPLIQRALIEVKAGGTLSSGEVEVLYQHLDMVRDWYDVSWEMPEYKDLLAKVIASYDEIAHLALRNEARKGGDISRKA